ncbi:prepilin-type N-terminal cleavage/methylation domain-containing protein [Bacillus cereus]
MQNEEGFTLLEMLLVMVVLMYLAMIMPMFQMMNSI